MRGTNSDERDQFVKLDISNESYMTQIKNSNKNVCGLDQLGNLWQWGKHTSTKQIVNDVPDDCIDNRVDDKKPGKYNWFQKQNLKILDFDCGADFILVKCQEPDNSIGFYGVACKVSTIKAFGENYKLQFHDSICKLSDEFFGLEGVQLMSCGKYNISFIKKNAEEKPI